MNFCVNCGAKLDENAKKMNMCVKCGTIINNNVNEYINYGEILETRKSDNEKKNNTIGIVSFILSLIPLILFIQCLISSKGSMSEADEGAVWWIMVIYFQTIGIPIAIISFICAIISCKIGKNKYAIISLILNFFPCF